MKHFYIAALSISLIACGGSDGSSDSNNTVSPSELKLEVVQQTYCGSVVPATNAELVIYDNNWQITHRFKPDSNGKIVGTGPQATHANLSFIEDTNDGGGRRVTVESFAAYPLGDLGRFAIGTKVQGDCECIEFDLQVNLPASSSWQRVELIGSLASAENSYSDQVVFDDVRVCRDSAESWHELIVTTKLSENKNIFYGTLNDYAQGGSYTLDLIDQAEPRSVNISPVLESAYVRQVFKQGQSVDYLTNLAEYLSLANVSTLEGTHLTAYNFDSISVDGLNISQDVFIRKELESNSSQTPEIVSPDTDPATALADVFISLIQSDSLNYKINNAGSYYAVYAQLSGGLSDNTYYNEYYNGPLEGRMPENALPSDYGLTTMIDNMEQFHAYLTLFSYPHLNSYTEFTQANIERSSLTGNEWFSGKWSEYRALTLSISN